MVAVTRSKVGYKKLRNGWIAKLQILGKTNERRKGIINHLRAKYRTSQARVLEIFKNGKTTQRAIGGWRDKNFKYKVGKVVEVNDFDTNIDVVCSKGIHYFKTLECANLWQLDPNNNYTGTYKEWNENGLLVHEIEYKDGKRHGTYKAWNANGLLVREIEYVNEKEHGAYKLWHNNGQLYLHTKYVNGERHGPLKAWYSNGQPHVECEYVNGQFHGLHKCWYENGQLREEADYVNGKRHLYKR